MAIEIIGAYLPRLTPERISRFIDEDVADFLKTMRDLRQRGVSDTQDDELLARAKELREEIEYSLKNAALFELKVSSVTAGFDVFAFHEPTSTQVAWEPAWLSEDGESRLCESHAGPPEVPVFRVAFYIHEWSNGCRLSGPDGPVELPTFAPVPERLWRLATYDVVD